MTGDGSTPRGHDEPQPTRLEPPRLLLLGVPTVEGASGPAPVAYTAGRVIANHTARATELLTYLSVHPAGVGTAELSTVHSPRVLRSPATLHSLVSRMRRWLGTDESGRPWLPRARAGGLLALDPRVRSDWDDWRRLVGDPARATVPELEAASALIRAQPLTGTAPGRWGWADDLRQEMIDAIVEALHVLVGRHLDAGRLGPARRFSACARTIDPTNELLWRDALTVELRAGDVQAQRRLIAQLVTIVDPREDLEPETARLISSG